MRVLARNISAGVTATAFAAITLAGVATIGLAPSPAEAATMQGHTCGTAASQCGETTGTAPKKKTPNLAARALSNKVVMDIMLGNAKSNPDLTVGCGVSGICVTLIPDHPADPDHVGVPGILELTSTSGSGPLSLPSPPVDTAYIAGDPATGRSAGRSTRVAAAPAAVRAFSTGPAGGSGSNPPGQNPGVNNPGDPGNPGGQGPGKGPANNGPAGDPGGPSDGNENPDEGQEPDEETAGPGPVFEPPFIDVDEPVEVIRVPEPSTLFIFGFALLAMAAFGARQTQTAANGNRVERARR